MVSVCLPSDALLQHLPSYMGFSYLGRGVSLHGYSSKAQLLLFTLDKVTPPVILLLLLLSCFSHVRLSPETAAHQAPLSLGFSRQEHWSGLPFPSPMRKSEVAQSCLTPSDPMDCCLPGSSVHGIFQARGLEWVPAPSPASPLENLRSL